MGQFSFPIDAGELDAFGFPYCLFFRRAATLLGLAEVVDLREEHSKNK